MKKLLILIAAFIWHHIFFMMAFAEITLGRPDSRAAIALLVLAFYFKLDEIRVAIKQSPKLTVNLPQGKGEQA